MTIDSIDNWARSLRKKQLKKEKQKPSTEPISSWVDKIRLRNEAFDSVNIILRTKGCDWANNSGCTMCGYLYDASPNVSQRDILKQIKKAIDKFEFPEAFYVKIFTSGSFLDDNEVSKETRSEIVDKLNKINKFKGLSIESRPEYISESKIKRLNERVGGDLIVGIGLETSSDEIRAECVNKGFSLEDFREALEISMKNNAKVKTYLLLKPPFLSERTSIDDTINSAKKASELGSFKISVNPCNVQRGTIVEELYKNKEYRSPWLWSLLKVLKEIDDVEATVVSDPVAAGKERGVHNCGECDDEIISDIREYSITQNPNYLEDHYCECKEEWKTIVKKEVGSHNIIS